MAMDADLYIRGKYTFRLNEQKLILVKKAVESRRHVVMKALLWGLYLPAYPGLRVEVPTPRRDRDPMRSFSSPKMPMFASSIHGDGSALATRTLTGSASPDVFWQGGRKNPPNVAPLFRHPLQYPPAPID
jgi:hypothetical protein